MLMKLTKGETAKPDSLDGVTILKNQNVSIIPGTETILSQLKNHKPSITLAIQIVGIYLYSNKNDRDFIKILKLDNESPSVVSAKHDIFKAIHNWCMRVENCRDL
jgi:hypothetical protein